MKSTEGRGYESLSHLLLFHKLQLRDESPRVRIRLPNTLLCWNGQIVKWLFTSKDGTVLSKHQKHASLCRYIASVIQAARRQNSKVVCVAKSYLAREERYRVEFLDELQALDLLEVSKSTLPLNLVSLQEFVPRESSNQTLVTSICKSNQGDSRRINAWRLSVSTERRDPVYFTEKKI